MSTQHTPGPWVAIYPKARNFHDGNDITSYAVMSEKTRRQLREEGREHYDRSNEDVNNVGIVSYQFWRDMKDDEAKANARLIAAAPELLEELKRVREVIAEADQDLLNGIDAVIAKATGSAA